MRLRSAAIGIEPYTEHRRLASSFRPNSQNGESDMERARKKPLGQPALTRAEQKAAEIDNWVKGHIAQSREARDANTSRLKALREAREAESSPVKPSPDQTSVTPPRSRPRMRRIWVSGSDIANDSRRRTFDSEQEH